MKLPDAWQIKRLEKLVQFSSGGTPSKSKPEFWLGDIPFISAATMHQQEIITSNLNISEEGLRAGSKLAKENDLLLLVRGSMLWKKIPICICKRDVAFNQDVKALSIKGEISATYLLYWFLAHQRFLLNKVGGTGIGAGKLDFDELKTLDILLPPLPEQKAIADLLSTWDKAIEKTEQLIQAKETRFKWLLRELISKPQNTQKDTKWKKVKIGSFLTESRISGNNGLEAQKITVKLYGKGVIPKGEKRIGSKTTQYYVRKAGQFIYSKLDFLNGAFGIIPNDLDGFESTQDLPAFDISDAVLKEWFLYYLIRPEYYNRQLGLARGQRKARRVNPTEFLNSKIRLPPVEEQKAIAETLSICQHEIDLLKQLVGKYKTQKSGLMQKLLTGEWRVKLKIVNQYMEA